MSKDTDGTNWMIVRYTVDVDVIADNDEDALYFADLALSDWEWQGTGTVLLEDE